MKKIIIAAVLSFIFLAPLTMVSAAGPFDQATQNLNKSVGGLGLPTTVEGTVGTVIKGVLGLVGTIFFALTIYAGILWMTASGNEEKVTKATDIIKAAVIGLFITMAAYAITTFVASKIGAVGTPDTGTLGCCVGNNQPAACAAQLTSTGCNTNAVWQAGVCPSSCTVDAGK